MDARLTVHAHAADEGGCGHYRIRYPAEAINADDYGMDVDIVHDGKLTVSIAEDPARGLRKVVDAKADCDVLIIQRPLQRDLADAIPHLQRNGVAVVVELDDDFQAIHRDNVAFPGVQPRSSPDRNWQHLMRACTYADVVTVTTPNLARKYGHRGNAVVLPNYIPTDQLGLKRWTHPGDTRPLRFTWSGSVATHPTDLQQAAAGFQQLCRDDGPGECHVVGTGIGVASRLGLGPDRAAVTEPHPDDPDNSVQSVTRPNPLVHASGEWVPIDQYLGEVAKHTDVGVVPLDDTPFNRGKSWLKGLEFASQGRPFIASATEPYVDLANHGLGVIAKKPRDWVKLMRRMVDDPTWAEDMGAAHMEIVADQMTYEHNAHRWAAVYARAAAMRKAQRTTVVV